MPDKDTLEEIKKALDAATPGPWEVEYAIITSVKAKDRLEIIGTYIKRCDALLIANSPEWLRYLLEQNKQLQAETDLWKAEYNRAKSDVLKLEVNLGEERDRWKEEALLQARLYTEKNEQLERLRGELEQVSAEREDYRKELEWYGDVAMYDRIPQEIDGEIYYGGEVEYDRGERARYILQRYERGDNTDGDDGKAPSDLG